MSLTDRWQYEMMGTAELANECRLIKAEADHYAAMKKTFKDTGLPEYKDYHRRYRAARIKYLEVKKILQSRQMKLF